MGLQGVQKMQHYWINAHAQGVIGKALDTLKHEYIYSEKISFTGGFIFWLWLHLFVGEGGLFSIELDVALQYESIQYPFVQQGIYQLDVKFFARGLRHYTAFDSSNNLR